MSDRSPAKYLVIYHAGCRDGLVAASVCAHVASQCGRLDETVFHAARYGSYPPWELLDPAVTRVVVVDFSYPPEQMVELLHRSKELQWFDHHKTAIPALSALEPLRRQNDAFVCDMGASGALLAARAASPQGAPDLTKRASIIYTDDYDRWTKKIAGCDAFKLGADLLWPVDSDPAKVYQEVLSDDLAGYALEIGGHLLKAQAVRVRLQARQARRVKGSSPNLVTVAVNATCDPNELGDYLTAQEPPADVAAIYYQTSKGTWRVSLRSRRGVDVSEIAATFPNGGGHAGAAGFEVPDYPADFLSPFV